VVATFLNGMQPRILCGRTTAALQSCQEKGSELDRQAYVDHIIDHFQNPRNKGRMDDADVPAWRRQPRLCGPHYHVCQDR
jgi:hypothetical protein